MKRLFTSLILLFLLNGLPGHSAPDRKKGESAYSPGMVAVDITTLKPLSEADSSCAAPSTPTRRSRLPSVPQI